MSTLNITVSHDVPGTDLEGVTTRSLPIPPDYDDRDLKAFFAYEVTMTAIDHARERIGHEEVHKALIAAHARLAVIERLQERLDGPVAAELLEYLSVSNEEAIERWAEGGD